jgi:hypothetical protein
MNVSDQNFRRELTAVFVEMSEKISPALRDRVPASIAQRVGSGEDPTGSVPWQPPSSLL